tara:strand:- start:160 stop:1086 length:927 start_codon:yes stop_codon:yes gene_type:complete
MKLSIVTPIYKDSELATDFITEVMKVDFHGINLVEIIFVIDGGDFQDKKILSSIAKTNSLVKVIVLSRNFGQHIALSAGYANSIGDYICMINVDMQEPPYEISKLLYVIDKEKNIDIIYGIRTNRMDSYFKSLSSKLFNLLLNKLTGDNTPINAATIRIMTRKFIQSYNELTEKSRYIPGLENWIGYEKKYIPIVHTERKVGKSSYTIKKRISMAFESIISFSDLPLRWTAYFGIFLSIIGFLFLIILLFLKMYLVDFKPGYISTISVITFIGGIQIFVIGIASIYIGRILKEVQNRPLYIIKEKYNL